jgi:signal transduction histidine kinase
LYAVDHRFSRSLRTIKTFSERILTAHEEERKRLARELHDGLGQSLLTTKFNLQRMNREDMNEAKKERLIEGAIDELSRSIDELRDISAGLRPPFLEEMGLAVALQMHAEKLSRRIRIDVDVAAPLDVRPSAQVEDNLFRIFQEAVSNAAKHSGAKRMSVALTRCNNTVIMEIKDDGSGFDYDQARRQGRGIGLDTMKERVHLLGGSLHLRSRTGWGTSIRVEVPFE